MSVQVFLKLTELNSKHCTQNTKQKVKVVRQSKHKICGSKYWNLKLRQEHHTCCTKMQRTLSRINRTLELSNRLTYVQKLSSTLRQTKSQFVTWLHWHFLNSLLKMEDSITTNCSR